MKLSASFKPKTVIGIIALAVAVWCCRRLMRSAARFPRTACAVIVGIAAMVYADTRWAFLMAVFVPLGIFVVRMWRTARNAFGISGVSAIIQATIRVGKVKRRWERAALAANLVGRLDKEAPTMAGIHAVREAVAATIDLGGSGLTVSDVQKSAASICSSMRCRVVRVREGEMPSECDVEFRWGDPLRDIVELEELAYLEWPENELEIGVGITEDEELSTVDTHLSLLAVGETGSGKSGLIWAILAGFQERRIPVRVRAVDPKRIELAALGNAGEWVWTTKTNEQSDGKRIVRYHGVNRLVHGMAKPVGPPPKAIATDKSALRICRPCLFGETPLFHIHEYTNDPKDAKRVVDNHAKAREARQTAMSGLGRVHRPTLREPHDLLIIDELLLLPSLLKDGIESALGETLVVGRATAFTVIACAQLSQKETIGPVRDLFPRRVALALRNRELTDAVLGTGATSEGAACHKISLNTPGIGYQYAEGQRGYARFRVAYADDAATRIIAAGLYASAVQALDDADDDLDDDAADDWTAPEESGTRVRARWRARGRKVSHEAVAPVSVPLTPAQTPARASTPVPATRPNRLPASVIKNLESSS